MGLKSKIVLGVVEIAAMLFLKIYTVKVIHKMLPRGARVRRFPDGTTVVKPDDPAYNDESSRGTKNAADLLGSESSSDKGLRKKTRRVLRRWKLSWRNLFYKSYRADQWPKEFLESNEEALSARPLSFNKLPDSANRKREPGEAE